MIEGETLPTKGHQYQLRAAPPPLAAAPRLADSLGAGLGALLAGRPHPASLPRLGSHWRGVSAGAGRGRSDSLGAAAAGAVSRRSALTRSARRGRSLPRLLHHRTRKSSNERPRHRASCPRYGITIVWHGRQAQNDFVELLEAVEITSRRIDNRRPRTARRPDLAEAIDHALHAEIRGAGRPHGADRGRTERGDDRFRHVRDHRGHAIPGRTPSACSAAARHTCACRSSQESDRSRPSSVVARMAGAEPRRRRRFSTKLRWASGKNCAPGIRWTSRTAVAPRSPRMPKNFPQRRPEGLGRRDVHW